MKKLDSNSPVLTRSSIMDNGRLHDRQDWDAWQGEEIEGAIKGRTLFIKTWSTAVELMAYGYQHVYILREAVTGNDRIDTRLFYCLKTLVQAGSKVTVEMPIGSSFKFYAKVTSELLLFERFRLQLCVDVPDTLSVDPNIELRIDYPTGYDVKCYGITFINAPDKADYKKDTRLI